MPKPFTLNHRTFPHAPADEELGVLLGDAAFAAAIDVDETDAALVLRLPRPSAATTVLVLALGIALTALPLYATWLAPGRQDRHHSLVWGLVLFLWVVVIPGILLLLRWMRRKAERRVPGAIVDKRTHSLRLPRYGRVVEHPAIAYVAEVTRPYRTNGDTDTVLQLSVVLYEPDRTYSQWPIETCLGRKRFRVDPASRLADALDVRVKRVRLDRLNARAADEAA